MTITNRIRQALAQRIGYQTAGKDFGKVHHTLTWGAALQWASCYPIAHITRKGQWIATKTTNTPRSTKP